jgi:hypothetical protein
VRGKRGAEGETTTFVSSEKGKTIGKQWKTERFKRERERDRETET